MENTILFNFEAAVTDSYIRTLQIIHYAMAMAIISIATVFFILIQSDRMILHSGSLPELLSLVHAVSACSALPIGLVLFNRFTGNAPCFNSRPHVSANTAFGDTVR